VSTVIVVGAGLFGSVCGALAESVGHSVTYVDEFRPEAGSTASAGLVKPSWLEGFGQAGKIGLEVLDQLYGLEDLTFRMEPSGRLAKVHYINPSKVLRWPIESESPAYVAERVTWVGDGVVRLLSGDELTADAVLVATGVWAKELVNIPYPIHALAGSAFLYEGDVSQPVMRLWAPYKQIKVFNREPGVIWTGDSTGIKPESYTPARQRESRERCEQALRHAGVQPGRYRTISGLRPVIAGHRRGYFARVYPRTWVATGGGKMGSVLAGYQATQFLKAIS
jgi:glycine/D-amino acid oxidase-like deaminating enzyme